MQGENPYNFLFRLIKIEVSSTCVNHYWDSPAQTQNLQHMDSEKIPLGILCGKLKVSSTGSLLQ